MASVAHASEVPHALGVRTRCRASRAAHSLFAGVRSLIEDVEVFYRFVGYA